MKTYGNCPVCGEPLVKWFVYDDFTDYIGCSSTKCNYKHKVGEQ